ncbi:MAG: ATP-binding protein [Deltaproteobacteria bacterium]|nr:ATP-binding protein [Deltaproteobacteria bacterium]
MRVNETARRAAPKGNRHASIGGEISVELTAEYDALLCSRFCYQLGEEIGFTDRELWEISIVVSELVTNALKFAGGGRMLVRLLPRPRPGIEIEVEDDGPGIADVDAALRDGYSEGRMLDEGETTYGRSGLGIGLGAVKRHTDELSIHSGAVGGTRVTARKWLHTGDGLRNIPRSSASNVR